MALHIKNWLAMPPALQYFLAPPTFERVPARPPEDLPVLQADPNHLRQVSQSAGGPLFRCGS